MDLVYLLSFQVSKDLKNFKRYNKNNKRDTIYTNLTGIPTLENNAMPQTEETRLPIINIGPNHQADLPELYTDRIDLHRAPEQLLWDPGINDALDDNEGINVSHFTNKH